MKKRTVRQILKTMQKNYGVNSPSARRIPLRMTQLIQIAADLTTTQLNAIDKSVDRRPVAAYKQLCSYGRPQ